MTKINTIGDRIRKVRKATGKTQQAFADIIGLKRNTIATYEMGKALPSDRTIVDICREFNISRRWLETGEGSMTLELSKDADFLRIMAQIQVSDDNLIKSILAAYWKLDDEKKAAIRELVDSFIAEYNKNAGR